MPGISAVGTLARYFSLRFFLAVVAVFILCCVLIFFVDFIEMLRRFPVLRRRTVEQSLRSLRSDSEVNPLMAEYVDQGLYEGRSILVLDMDLCTRCDECTKGCIREHGDESHGVPITRYTRRSLRRLMGIVSQETVLLNDTVLANIAYGRTDFTLEQVRAAARAANADEFVLRLPDGYQTMLGERGTRLSGGQRQRIAIARALLRDPPLLILDEATSALDTESERLVQEAIERLMEHRTVFVIAHRLATVQDADFIVVLAEGRIVERGSHDDLLAADGLYRRLYNLQFRT